MRPEGSAASSAASKSSIGSFATTDDAQSVDPAGVMAVKDRSGPPLGATFRQPWGRFKVPVVRRQ